jgi:hypothetical protein
MRCLDPQQKVPATIRNLINLLRVSALITSRRPGKPLLPNPAPKRTSNHTGVWKRAEVFRSARRVCRPEPFPHQACHHTLSAPPLCREVCVVVRTATYAFR